MQKRVPAVQAKSNFNPDLLDWHFNVAYHRFKRQIPATHVKEEQKYYVFDNGDVVLLPLGCKVFSPNILKSYF